MSTILLTLALCACGGGGEGSEAALQADAPQVEAFASEGGLALLEEKARKKPRSGQVGEPAPVPEPVTEPPPDASPSEPVAEPPASASQAVAILSRSNPIPAEYFAMHIGGLNDVPWPSVRFTGLRLWDSWGYNPIDRAYVGISWTNLHTGPGQYNWALFDSLVDKVATQGHKGFYTFGYAPPWLTGGNTRPPTTPEQLARWEEFVAAVVERAAGRIKIWGMWNEPNGSTFYSGTPAQLAEMAKRAYPIIKRIDPTAIITTPEVQGNGSGWLAEYFKAGGGAYADVVAFHQYGYPDWRAATSGGALQAIAAYKAARDQAGLSRLPLWNTEFSSHTWADSSDKDFIGKAYPLYWAAGVDRNYWYQWENNQGYGRLWEEGQVNAAGIAFEQVRRWLTGAVMSGPVTVSGSVYSVDISRPDGYQGKIVWHDHGNSNFPVHAGKYVRSRNLGGGSQSIAANSTSVPISNSAILLETK
jgi:hypothetical protein